MQRHSSPFSYDQICLLIFYLISTFHYDSWLNYCSREKEPDEKTDVSRISCDSLSFVDAADAVSYCAAYTRAFASTGTADQDMIAKHFHGGGLSRRLSWDLRGSENQLGYRLGPSDLIFDA